MEFLALLDPVILSPFSPSSCSSGSPWRDIHQLEKSVSLPAERKLQEKAIISQQRRFDLHIAAMPVKILDQVIDVVDNILKDFPYDTLKACLLKTRVIPTPCLTMRSWMCITSPCLWAAGSCLRCCQHAKLNLVPLRYAIRYDTILCVQLLLTLPIPSFS